MSGRVPLSSLTPAPTEDLDAPPRADTALDTATLPTADDILGPPPKPSIWDVQPAALGAGPTAQAAETNAPAPGATPLPTADDILGPPPGAERESAKRVLAAFGHGFGETMAGGPAFTLEDPVTQESLKAVGLLPDLKKGQDGLLAAFGQQILLPAVKAAGWAATGISAGISGLQAAVEQKGIELGMPQLGRELAALPEAFPQEFGGAPGVLVRGYRPPIPPVVQQASDLGVIGAGDLGWKGYEAIPKPGDEVAATQARIQVAREVANENRQAAMPYAYGPTAETPAAPFQPYGAQIEQVATDVHQAARQIAPETFSEYDGLYQQRDELRSQIAASQQELQERAAAQAPGAAEIADLERRLEDTTPRLAKKYEARLAELRPAHDAFLNDEFTMGALTRDTPEIDRMRQDLQAVDYRMRDLAPDVTAAYREAEKQFPTETQAAGTTPERGAVETTGAIPSATAATPAPRTVAEYVDDYIAGKGRDSPEHEQFAANNAPAIEAEFQRRAAAQSGAATTVTAGMPAPAAVAPVDIAADVAQRFAAAGRPAEEADALGTLAAHYYDARAARLGSTAADLYQQEPLTIRSKASGGPKGQAAGKAFIEGGRSIITLFTGRADASTAIHELGHAWLEDLLKDASNPAATDATRADAAATRGWLNAEPTADITTRQHEKFARAFERYMYEGQAPSTGLRGVFEQFAGWLRDVYATIRDAGKPISDDIRDVFDRFLAREPEERAVIAPEVPLEKPPMPRGPAQIMAEEAAAGRKIGEKRAKAMSDAEFGRYADWQEANRRKKPEAAAPAPVATPPPTAAVVAEAVRNEPVERLSNEVGVDPAGLTVSEFYGAIAQKIDAAEEATRLESEHAAEFMETDDAVHDWATHTGLVYADFTPHITELEAEDAYRQAAAAPAAPDRAELGERPAPATGSEGEGESGGGMGGRGAASGRRGASGGGQPGRGGTGDIADKAGNIRLDNLGGTEAMNAAIREIVAANGDYLDRRYGDAAYSAEKEVWATRELERQAAFDYAEKGRKGAASGSPADVAAYLEARERLNMVSGRLSELTASAGRTLRAFRAMPEFAAGEDIAAFAQRVAGKTLYQIQEEMRLAGTLNEWSGPQFARSMSESTWARTRSIMIAYYINALISGPITHAAYMVGNTNFALFKALGETSIQATIGAAREAIAGEPVERIHFQEVSAQLYGMMRGLRDGISPAVQALKTGVPVMKGLAADELGLGAMGARPQVIPGLAGRILETPSRAVAAIHTLFYSMGYEQEIARLAVRDAFANSLVPGTSEFDTHIARYTMQPRVEDIEAAHNEALGMVLMKRPAYGSAQYHLVAAINKDPTGLSKVVMPFMQIGMNILEKGIVEETPLAYLQKASRDDLLGRNGQIRRDIRAGKIIAGSMLGLTTVGLAMEGLITGGGPSDPKQRAIWMAAGNRPYSVSIGGVNLPYRKLLGPLGPLMGATADIYEVGHALDEKGLSEAAASAAFGFSEVVADESWMSGLSNFVEAVKGGPKAASYIRNSLMAWMPFSSGMRQTARLVDPYQRRVTDLVDAARNMVPGLSMQDYPQRDVWGEPIVSTQMALPSIARPDPVAAKMDELGLSVSRLNPEVRGVRLSPQQYDDYSRIAGKLSRMLLSGGVTTPGFSALPPETQKAWVTRQVDVAREQARQNVMAMYPDIMRQAAENKARQVRVR